MGKWKTRTDGSAAQIGNRYQEESRDYPYGAKRRGSGANITPQNRSVASMQSPEYAARGMYPLKHPVDATIHLEETEDGDQKWVLKKGDKWFDVEYDTSDEELQKLAQNFDKEWRARVGQYLEDDALENED